jgi:hypothetical protein
MVRNRTICQALTSNVSSPGYLPLHELSWMLSSQSHFQTSGKNCSDKLMSENGISPLALIRHLATFTTTRNPGTSSTTSVRRWNLTSSLCSEPYRRQAV